MAAFFSRVTRQAYQPPPGLTAEQIRALFYNGSFRMDDAVPLVVPEKCQFRVGYDTRGWTEGEVMIFDDTIEHEAVNGSDQVRVILLFDVWNPLLSLEERQIVQKLSEVERKFRYG